MTIFQLIMLGGSAYFALKIYEHIQTLKDPENKENNDNTQTSSESTEVRTADSFSTLDSSTLIEKADAQRENGNLDKAIGLYREAEIKDSNNPEILFKMGLALSMAERDTEALEYLIDAIKIDSDNPFAYKEVSKLYEKLGDEQNAKIYKDKAVEIDADI